MADTGQKNYSLNEAVNRILRALRGAISPNDNPGTLAGEVLSVNDGLSALAELIEGNDPNNTFTIPTAATIVDATTSQKGVVELATSAETVTGTDTTRAVTPAGTLAAILANTAQTVDYGEIYTTSTGTAQVTLSTSWAKVTGSFAANTASTDDITPDYANDRILVNKAGTYFVGLNLSFSGAANATFTVAAYLDSVRQDAVTFRRKMGATGDVGSASALGIVSVTGSSYLEVWARCDLTTKIFKLEAGQMFVYGVDQE